MCQHYFDALDRYYENDRTIATCRKCGAIRSMTDDEFRDADPVCVCDGGDDLTGQFFNGGCYVVGHDEGDRWVCCNPHEGTVWSEEDTVILAEMDFEND